MGYAIKVQKVQRPTNKSFYVTLPSPIAEALNIVKGEEFFWEIEDKNTLVLRRHRPVPPRAGIRPAEGGPRIYAEGDQQVRGTSAGITGRGTQWSAGIDS